ncbi:stalk domain-containing protein [Paenibacillus tyrfis]|uniref:stalk domain-containing protein n=1 Tax=Paenibacillus tyrfis TaxID=1501230 RepID=UPI0009DF7352
MNEETRSVVVSRDRNQIQFFINDKIAYLNHTKVELAESPFIHELYQSAYVPLTSLLEALLSTEKTAYTRIFPTLPATLPV